MPSFIDHDCAVCSWDRTLAPWASVPATYTAEVDAPAGMTVTVTPSEFTISPGTTQDIQVTVDATGLPAGEWAFADVRLVTTDTHANGLPISSVHYPIGVIANPEQTAPEITVDPEEITAVQGPDQVVTHELTIGNVGDADLDWSVFENEPTQLPETGPAPVATGPAPEPTAGNALSTRFNPVRGVFGPPTPRLVTPEAQPTQGEVTLTHSQSQAIEALNSVACSPDGGVTTTENGYLRHFVLDDFGITTDFEVTDVSFGVEQLQPIAQDLTVNLFTMIDPEGPFDYPNFDPIGSATQSVPPQDLSIVTLDRKSVV